MNSDARASRPKPNILHGSHEPIFSVLPLAVLDNFGHARSESALLWNLIYPLAQPTLSLEALHQIRPLWGAALHATADDALKPYFWGYSIEGERLPHLDVSLDRMDGSGARTEVDLFLVGQTHLILVEAKHFSRLGRCSRFGHGRCPEVHQAAPGEERRCRYWEPEAHRFQDHLRFGARPKPGGEKPPCERHYQLARTLLLGVHLSDALGLNAHLWLLAPRSRWAGLARDWIDFTERVRDDSMWQRMRVLAWRDLQRLAPK